MGRMRSPNFPGLSLEDAVKAVGTIYDRNRQATIMREDAAKDLGYSGLTGRSLKVLGALNQYGLIDNISKGQLRVTQTAVDILHGYPEEVKIKALHDAGNAPPLFQSIYDRFDGDIPGENAVRSFLLQSGFTNQGVEKALRNFMDTNRYMEIRGAAESYGKGEVGVAESPSDKAEQKEKLMETSKATPDKSAIGAAVFWNKGELDFNLSSAGLAVTGATNSASELKAYIAKLEALVALLPDEQTEH